MVERMKRLSILIHSSMKELFLENLQQLGVVDLNMDFSKENDKISDLKFKINRIKKAKNFLISFLKENKVKENKKIVCENISDLLGKIENSEKEYESLLERIKQTDEEIKILERWGEFDPIIFAKLEKEGIFVRFYSCSSEEFEKISEKGYNINEISKDGNTIYFVLFTEELVDLQEAKLEKVPMKKLSEVITHKNHLQTLLKEAILSISSMECYLKDLDEEMNKLSDELFFELGRENFSNLVEDKVLYITGYFPVKSEKKVRELLDKNDVVYYIENPDFKNEDVPVKLKNDKFSSLFEVITKLNSLPKYYELDPTPFTAPFFALFFGLCIADVGYGIIMLLATLGALFFVKDKSFKSIAMLGVVLSITTIIGGILLNTVFGLQILSLPVPEDLKKFVVFTDMNSAMGFAIFLGVLQVSVGYILQIINKIRLFGIEGALQPLGVLLLFLGILSYAIVFIAPGDMSIGPIRIKYYLSLVPFSKIVFSAMAIVGLILILLFNNISQKIFIRPLIGLWELYGVITGVPGDILSYLRLFALGLAGGLLGNAFNQIALMVRGDGNVLGIIFMTLILIVGHGLNLVLALLGAFVHPLRLTLLEFYKAVGFTGGGRPYRPFRKSRV
ncbi:MAG: V-type ATP synthase subunit I [Brevinematia bacterium]